MSVWSGSISKLNMVAISGGCLASDKVLLKSLLADMFYLNLAVEEHDSYCNGHNILKKNESKILLFISNEGKREYSIQLLLCSTNSQIVFCLQYQKKVYI